MANRNNSLLVLIIGWLTIAGIYVSHTPPNHRSYDFNGHVDYTKIIVNESRLPKPNFKEVAEGVQPPLYYFLNSLIAGDLLKINKKSINIDSEKINKLLEEKKIKHLNIIRGMSVLYGLITLITIFWLLNKTTSNILMQLLVLFFIASTPRFVFIFSTYNNDSLAIMFSILIIALSYKLNLNWSWDAAYRLLLVSILGVYSKCSVILCIGIIVLMCCKNIFFLKPLEKNKKQLVTILILAVLSIFPWFLMHDYRYTGNLFPNNYENVSYKKIKIEQLKSTLKMVFRIPLIQSEPHEWNDPWAHVYPMQSSKKNDYWAYSFVSSIIGLFIFQNPSVNVVWIMLFIHLIVYIYGVSQIFKSEINKLCGLFILLSHVGQMVHLPYIYSIHQGWHMDYRYISWCFLPWAILYASTLENKGKFYSWFFERILIIGIIVHIYFLATVSGNSFA
ncbi:MAG: hypothetical protein HY094_04280 [Candidatus Melainabacteria bacterium]|nr:hypothetical protein [Candidatus Melainabacteria bacterium]